jgi:hypothetical protein
MVDQDSARGWVPVDACTLPTDEQPLRAAEFDELFASAIRSVEVETPTRARFLLVGGDALAGRVERLAAAESSCCSFFSFTVAQADASSDAGAVTLDVEVPPTRADVLAALVARARDAGTVPS